MRLGDAAAPSEDVYRDVRERIPDNVCATRGPYKRIK
jgi:hypothetical protein